MAEFVAESFSLLEHIHPGTWHVLRESEKGAYMGLSSFEQYAHLEELDKQIEETPKVAIIIDATGGTHLPATVSTLSALPAHRR